MHSLSYNRNLIHSVHRTNSGYMSSPCGLTSTSLRRNYNYYPSVFPAYNRMHPAAYGYDAGAAYGNGAFNGYNNAADYDNGNENFMVYNEPAYYSKAPFNDGIDF